MQQHSRDRAWRVFANGMIGIVIGLALGAPVLAADYTWTNTANGTSDYWTNGVMWRNVSGNYPGSAASGNAWLTNNSAGGAYTNLLNSGLGNSIGTLVISNGDNGQAWLIITNNAAASGVILSNTTLNIGGGGRLQVASGGVITGLTSVTMSGNGGSLVAADGGQIFGAGAITFNTARYGNTITMGGGVWDLNANALVVGGGAGSSNNTFNVVGGVLTNIGTISGGLKVGSVVGANFNSVIVTNDGRLVMTNGVVLIGSASYAAAGGKGNTAILSNSALTVHYDGVNDSTSIGVGSSNNTLTLLNGTFLDNANSVLVIGGQTFTATLQSYSNLLTVDGGVITNAGKLIIGANSYSGGSIVAKSNQVNVINSGVISNISQLWVGGGTGSAGSGYNSLVVTGGGHLFMSPTATSINVGSAGAGNNTVILSDSSLVGNSTLIGSGSSNNSMTVADSIWDNRGGALTVGHLAATGNVVMVSGSTLTNFGVISVGGSGTGTALGNQLVIENGILSNFTVLQVGAYPGNHANAAVLTNNFGAFMGVSEGLNAVWVGGTGQGIGGNSNTLIVSNSLLRSGTAVSGGAPITAGRGSSNNTLTLLAKTIVDNQSQGIVVGGNVNGSASYNLQSAENVMTLNGAIISNAGLVAVGYAAGGTPTTFVGVSNRLEIIGGGLITNATSLTVGSRTGAATPVGGYNSLIVTGGGFFMTSAGAIQVGNSVGSDNNSVILSNSVLLGNATTSIGAGSSGNSIELLTNALWNQGGQALYIGKAGTGTLAMGATGNVLTINGGILTNVGEVRVGNYDAASIMPAFNSLVITNGGKMYLANSALTVGYAVSSMSATGSWNNAVMVSGDGSVLSNASNIALGLYASGVSGKAGYSNSLTIADGGRVMNTGAATLGGIRSGTNSVLVTDGGSTWLIGTTLELGASTSQGNSLVISNGAGVTTGGAITLGATAGADKNSLTVTGDGSSLTNVSSTLLGSAGNENSLTIADGGKMFTTISGLSVQIGSIGKSNTVTVTDTGSLWRISGTTTLTVGAGAAANYNQLIVSNGAMVVNEITTSPNSLWIGSFGGAAISNSAIVTGGGSVLSNAQGIAVGAFTGAKYNGLKISNGGQVTAAGISVGGTVSGSGGSDNSVYLTNAVLEANILFVRAGTTGNTISNVGGVFQFTQATPTITPNGAGNIAITDGSVSFRGISDADVTNSVGGGALSGIRFAGANTFMLNAASNTTAGQAYTFQAVGSNPSNYARLALINGETAYRGGGVTIDASGSLLISNTIASFTDVATNLGVAVLVNSTSTFSAGLVNQGTITNFANSSLSGSLTMNHGTFVTAGGTAQSLASSVNLYGSGTFDTAGGHLTLSGTITNAGGLTKIGGGNLVLPGANTFGGDSRPLAGLVVLANRFAVSNSTVNLAAGDTGWLVFSNTGTAFTLGGLKGGPGRELGLTNTDGTGIALSVGNNGQDTTFAGFLSGSGSLTKVGAGTLILNGANTYSGDTVVNQGALVLGGANTGSGNTFVNQGQLVLADPLGAGNGLMTVNVNGGLAFSNGTGFTLGSLAGTGNFGLTNTLGAGIGLAVGNNGQDTTYRGVISGSGSLTKQGAGQIELTASNTFSGAISVQAGRLLVNGSLAGGGPLALGSGSVLAGSGAVGRIVSGSGVVSPGNSPGILTVNQLNPSAGLGFEFEFTKLGSPDYTDLASPSNDVLRITNATPFVVALGLSNTVNLFVTTPLAPGVMNLVRGGFYTDSSAAFDSLITGANYQLWVNGDPVGQPAFVHTVSETTPWGSGRILEIGVMGELVPEPQVLMFWLAGATTLYAARRRMRRQQ